MAKQQEKQNKGGNRKHGRGYSAGSHRNYNQHRKYNSYADENGVRHIKNYGNAQTEEGRHHASVSRAPNTGQKHSRGHHLDGFQAEALMLRTRMTLPKDIRPWKVIMVGKTQTVEGLRHGMKDKWVRWNVRFVVVRPNSVGLFPTPIQSEPANQPWWVGHNQMMDLKLEEERILWNEYDRKLRAYQHKHASRRVQRVYPIGVSEDWERTYEANADRTGKPIVDRSELVEAPDKRVGKKAKVEEHKTQAEQAADRLFAPCKQDDRIVLRSFGIHQS